MEIETDQHLWDLWVGPESRHNTFVGADQRGGRLSESASHLCRSRSERRENEREVESDRREEDEGDWARGRERPARGRSSSTDRDQRHREGDWVTLSETEKRPTRVRARERGRWERGQDRETWRQQRGGRWRDSQAERRMGQTEAERACVGF